jgi:membrane-bound inhibitor of C-type lysozyme
MLLLLKVALPHAFDVRPPERRASSPEVGCDKPEQRGSIRSRKKALNLMVMSVAGMRGRVDLRQVGLAAAVLTAALRAMAADGIEPEAAIRARYLCQGRFEAVQLTALFFNAQPREVVLLQGEQAIRLPSQSSASGALYGAGAQSFWVKGDRATWDMNQTPAYACQIQTH